MLIRHLTAPLRTVAALIVVALLAACAPQLVAPYDPLVVEEVNAFNADQRAFMAAMNRAAGTPAGTYAENTAFYDHWLGRLGALTDYAYATDPAGTCPGTETFGGMMRDGLKAVEAQTGLLVEAPPAPPGGGCTARLLWLLTAQLQDLGAFHEAQGTIGLDPRGTTPAATMEQAVRAVLRVEMQKKETTP